MKIRLIITAVSIACCLSFLASQTSRHLRTPRNAFTMNFDYSRFRYTNTESYLEVYYAIYPSLVTLMQDSGMVRGIVDMETVIRNKTTDSVFVYQQVSLPILLTDTSAESLQRSFISKLTYALPAGSYILQVRTQDRLNHLRQDSINFPLEIINYSNGTMISDVDLCSNVISSTNKTNQFYKNSYEVRPHPSHFYGAAGVPVVFTYAELYNLKSDATYLIKAQVVDRTGMVLKERSRSRRFNVTSAVDITTLTITSIPSGKYTFVLLLTDSIGQTISRASKPIFIFNPKVEQKSTGLLSAKSAELAGLSEDELTDEFRKIRYISYSDDINMFNKLSTADAKREFLAQFWTSVENGERGRSDLTRAVYLERVLTANQRYRAMGKDGWFTDRGRIFILYAEPDEVQRFPNSDNSKPYEVWQYYQIENSVSFVFVDRSGFGNYTLVHSTKRGELQDDQWQQNLR